MFRASVPAGTMTTGSAKERTTLTGGPFRLVKRFSALLLAAPAAVAIVVHLAVLAILVTALLAVAPGILLLLLLLAGIALPVLLIVLVLIGHDGILPMISPIARAGFRTPGRSGMFR
jgi:hypothetical protein